MQLVSVLKKGAEEGLGLRNVDVKTVTGNPKIEYQVIVDISLTSKEIQGIKELITTDESEDKTYINTYSEIDYIDILSKTDKATFYCRKLKQREQND